MRVRLPHTTVYWTPGPADAHGQPTYGIPIELPCRWDDTVVETINAQGDLLYASSTVILLTDVQVGGLLFQGTIDEVLASSFPLDDPRSDRRVREIVHRTRNANLTGAFNVVQAFLR